MLEKKEQFNKNHKNALSQFRQCLKYLHEGGGVYDLYCNHPPGDDHQVLASLLEILSCIYLSVISIYMFFFLHNTSDIIRHVSCLFLRELNPET